MSGLKDTWSGRLPSSRGTLASGAAPPTSSLLDRITKGDPAYLGSLTLHEVYDIFALKQGDLLALARRLLQDRWPSITVIDAKPKRQSRKGPTVKQLVLVAEVDGIKEGCKNAIHELRRDGFTVDRIAAKTNITPKQVQAVIDGGEMSDEAAADRHLAASGRAKPGHNREVIERARQALKTRLSRARAAMRLANGG